MQTHAGKRGSLRFGFPGVAGSTMSPPFGQVGCVAYNSRHQPVVCAPSEPYQTGRQTEDGNMADRKQFQSSLTVSPELDALLENARTHPATEEELREQRISFAFGNAPQSADLITKDSVRRASQNISLMR